MKKISLFIISFIFVFGVCAPLAFSKAADYGLGTTVNQVNKDGTLLPSTVVGSSDPAAIIGKLIGWGLSFIGILFFILMLYSGVTWMIARGDTGKTDKAKNTIEEAIIGLILVIAAYAISDFVFSKILLSQ